MTLIKAILAMVLALGALTTTLSTSGHVDDNPPKCLPCSE
jgi:hypothetical protein